MGAIDLEVFRLSQVDSVIVPEVEIRTGFHFFYECEKLASEPVIRAELATLLANLVSGILGRKVASVVPGDNVSEKITSAILNESEA